ncbi:MAG: hypothetical protein Ct9H300mP9_3140 [Candidatus Neomarinimicrobiota bacterium]|nr:MAG: hypothetical protein Ct9H300mP9_3140 [Candidatus Neomarinimicrobiota bacterium]
MDIAPEALKNELWWGMSAVKVIWVLLFIGVFDQSSNFPIPHLASTGSCGSTTAISVLWQEYY